MRRLLVKDLLWELNSLGCTVAQRNPECIDWISSNLIDFTNEFVHQNKLLESYFLKNMNKVFKTERFELLLKRWIVEYLEKLFRALKDFNGLILEDNSINRFGAEKYYLKFGVLPEIKWRKQPSLLQRIISIMVRLLVILYLSLNKGLKISGRRKKYKIMRETIWGLYDARGYYFHDDFLVDGYKVKKKDLLLFFRGVAHDEDRLKAYHDAQKSSYGHFNLQSLPVSIGSLFSRVIPKYIISGTRVLSKEIFSPHFSLYWGIYSCFIYNALPYEKVFSHFEVTSELGHNFYAINHIVESIVCQNYGTRYYLMHWSDISLPVVKPHLSFLGCDGFLIWGNVHGQGLEVDPRILMPTGYVFKRFIKEVASNRDKVLSDIGIDARGKIISFFDENFGGECAMTEGDFVAFWRTILRVAQQEQANTIVVKPKDSPRYKKLSDELKKEFFEIKEELLRMKNVYIIDENKWSFMEAIGISDITVTQGMTSSATIAIICGIESLYLDQFGYKHPFAELFKDKVVFDNPERLISMIHKILKGTESPLKSIPERILRDYDTYSDDRGIDLFRSILSGETQRHVGIIVQARMGSTRLPGKVMRPILGRPMLEMLIERLKRSKRSDVLIVATTYNRNDDVIKRLADRLRVVCYRGDEDDVLNRYYEAAKEYNLDIVVRITADCPLIDPLLVDTLITYYFDSLPVDYVSNTIERTYPRGFDIEVFSFHALEKAAKSATESFEREHVTPYIFENMKKMSYKQKIDSSKYRVTVDTIEDFKLVSWIFEYFKENRYFGYRQVIDLLDSRQDLVEINQFVKQKAV